LLLQWHPDAGNKQRTALLLQWHPDAGNKQRTAASHTLIMCASVIKSSSALL
jgi:hypothetical protein